MKIAVAGAAGFIGSRLTARLFAEGHHVLAIDRVTYAPAEDERVEVVTGDLRKLDLEAALRSVDAVVNLAGRGNVRRSWTESSAHYQDNIDATDRLAASAAAVHVPMYMHVSSSSVYGGPTPWSESSPTVPASPYGVSKLAGEQLCQLRLVEAPRTSLTVVRLFSVFGPGQREDLLLSRLIESALRPVPFRVHGDGQQRRDFTYVDDVVESLVRLLRPSISGLFNVCRGESHSVLDLVEVVRGAIGPIDLLFEETASIEESPGARETLGDNSRLQSACGPIQWTRLEDGVRRQIEWRAATMRGIMTAR